MKDSSRLWYSDLVSGQEANVFFFFYNEGWFHDLFIYLPAMSLFIPWHTETSLILRIYIWIGIQVALNTNSTLKLVLPSVKTLLLISQSYQQNHFLILFTWLFFNNWSNKHLSIFFKVANIPHKSSQNIIQKLRNHKYMKAC